MTKVKIDKAKCIGCGACEITCPKSFKLKEGKAHYTGKESDCIKEAEAGCPVQAIKVS